MKQRTTTLTALAAAGLLVASSTSAMATEPQPSPDHIAAVIERAAPASSMVAKPDSSTDDTASFDLGETVVSVPTDPSKAVAINSPQGEHLEIALPPEVAINDGVVTRDGTVVYTSENGDAHAAVQTLDDGSVRLQTVMENSNAPDSYTYELNQEATPVLLDDGSVDVLEERDSAMAMNVIAHIGTPWAIDAAGESVPTWYTVDGDSITQHVDHDSSSAYPITADPTLSHGWGIYLHFNRAETKTISQAGWSPGTLGAICAGAAFELGAGAAAVGAACAAYAGSLVYTAGLAENSSPKRCLYTRYVGAGILIPGTYKDSRCR